MGISQYRELTCLVIKTRSEKACIQKMANWLPYSIKHWLLAYPFNEYQVRHAKAVACPVHGSIFLTIAVPAQLLYQANLCAKCQMPLCAHERYNWHHRGGQLTTLAHPTASPRLAIAVGS